MPIVLKNSSSSGYTIGVWEIIEDESFFLNQLQLSDNDNKLLDNAKNPQRRLEILSVRLLLKTLGLDFEIRHSKTGKPLVKVGNISISHTKHFSALIYHPQKRVCIDVEKVTNIIYKWKHIVFSNIEIGFTKGNPKHLTLLWCCKECVVKILDNRNIDFLNQIKIQPFGDKPEIMCDYISDNNDPIQFTFNYFNIRDHFCVWGIINNNIN